MDYEFREPTVAPVNDHEWHGNVSKAHPYQPNDRRIVYK